MHVVTENQFFTKLELQGCLEQTLPYTRKTRRACYLFGEKDVRIRVSSSLTHAHMHLATQEEIGIKLLAVEIFQYQYGAMKAYLRAIRSTSCRSCIIYWLQTSKQ